MQYGIMMMFNGRSDNKESRVIILVHLDPFV